MLCVHIPDSKVLFVGAVRLGRGAGRVLGNLQQLSASSNQAYGENPYALASYIIESSQVDKFIISKLRSSISRPSLIKSARA